jgi:hypothetical protein
LHSSDETGDERKGLATTGGTAVESDPAAPQSKSPPHAFRERIRRASVAAAQSSVPPDVTATDHAGASLVPPEQSGVHDRKSDEPPPGEPEHTLQADSDDDEHEPLDPTSVPTVKIQGLATGTGATPPGAISGLRRPTPPAWPFAGSAREERRPQYHTQLGLGLPQRTAIPTAKRESADSETSDARRRMDTRDTKRSGAAQASVNPGKPAPNAHKVTPARPFRAHDASKWSPTSTKPQRASLLRSDVPKSSATAGEPDAQLSRAPKQGVGAESEPSIQVDIATSLRVDVGQSEVSRLAAAPLDPGKYSRRLGMGATTLDGAGNSQAKQSAESADAASGEDSTRARRYTPKQRPTQRRNRKGAEASEQEQQDPARDAQLQADDTSDKDARELAVTVPDLRIPGSARPPALPFTSAAWNPSGATNPGITPVVTPDTPTQPRGRPVPRLPFAAPPASAFSPPAAFSHSPAFSPPPGFSQRPDAAFKPTGPRSPFAPPGTGSGAQREADMLAQHEASIVVDPTIHGQAHFTEVHPSQLSESPSGYQPLPSDPAAFEQLMRDQAAARGSRLNWKQQATLVIPRESLELPEERRFINPKVVFGFVAASAAGALLMLVISQFGDQGPAGLRVATDTSTSAAHAAAGNATVIATEPSGAELLLDGAVVGNAPLEVVRPPRGAGEHTYVVRLRGFTQELVRLHADSQTAIRVTLTPEPGVP